MNDFRNYVNQTLQERLIPGASVIVRKGDDTLLHEGFGWANREEQVPVSPDTVFGIGSVTKSFTSLAIMQLADEGKLSVDDPVADYLTDFTRSGETDLTGITLHHLLSNSSGLPPLPFLRGALHDSVRDDPNRELMGMDLDQYVPAIATTDELVRAMIDSELRLLRRPGVLFSYSNEGFAMLGRIVELVSGQRYEDYVYANILNPLDMDRSSFGEKEQDDVTELYSYIGGFERVEATPGWWKAPSMTAAGFLRSTTGDMARYGQVYLGNTDLISPDSLARMTHPHIQTSVQRWYGYGLMIQPDYHGRKMVEHGGNIKGVAAYLTMFPEEQLVSVALTNITGGPVADMALAGLNVPLGLPLHTEREVYTPVNLAEAQLRKFCGLYRSAENSEVEISLEDGQLQADLRQTKLRATPVARDSLLVNLNGANTVMRFLEEDASGFPAVFFGFRVLEKVS